MALTRRRVSDEVVGDRGRYAQPAAEWRVCGARAPLLRRPRPQQLRRARQLRRVTRQPRRQVPKGRRVASQHATTMWACQRSRSSGPETRPLPEQGSAVLAVPKGFASGITLRPKRRLRPLGNGLLLKRSAAAWTELAAGNLCEIGREHAADRCGQSAPCFPCMCGRGCRIINGHMIHLSIQSEFRF